MANLNGFLLKDEEKIILEIMCKQMIESLGSILTWIEEDKKKSYLYVNERKKEIFKNILIPNEAMKPQEFYFIKYQIVRVISFLFVCFTRVY